MSAADVGTRPVAGVVLVGAGLAAVRVAQELRAAGFAAPITMIGDESHAPYDRPPLSKEVLSGVLTNPPTLLTTVEAAALDVELMIGSPVIGLDVARQTVATGDGFEVPYDVLVIATGARARPWELAEGLSNVHALRTTEDAAKVRALIARSARLAVVGAGFIGSEVASTAAGMGCATTLIEQLPTPLARVLGPAAGKELAGRHLASGIDLRCATTVVSVTSHNDRAVSVLLSDGSEVDIDGIVVGLGVQPNCEWLASSGVRLGDGVLCDEVGRTSQERIFAVGDVACWVKGPGGEPRRVEHWTSATEQARIVASQILESPAGLVDRDVDYFWSDQHGIKIQLVGEAGKQAVVVRSIAQQGPERPIFLYAEAGRLTGAVGFGHPRAVMKLKPLVAAGAPVEAACELLHAMDNDYRVQELV